MRGQIAIIRKCRRCARWLSIDAFSPLGKLCAECLSKHGPHSAYSPSVRTYALTDKARSILKELAAA